MKRSVKGSFLLKGIDGERSGKQGTLISDIERVLV